MKRYRFADPLVRLLRQGLAPEDLALTFALGICLSCFPVLGATTILCTLAAAALRLNLPAIQLANYIAAPLQIALLIPLLRLGERLFHAQRMPLSPSQILAMYRAAPLHALRALWSWQWHAIVAWLLVAPPCCALLTVLLRFPLRRLRLSRLAAPESSES